MTLLVVVFEIMGPGGGVFCVFYGFMPELYMHGFIARNTTGQVKAG